MFPTSFGSTRAGSCVIRAMRAAGPIDAPHEQEVTVERGAIRGKSVTGVEARGFKVGREIDSITQSADVNRSFAIVPRGRSIVSTSAVTVLAPPSRLPRVHACADPRGLGPPGWFSNVSGTIAGHESAPRAWSTASSEPRRLHPVPPKGAAGRRPRPKRLARVAHQWNRMKPRALRLLSKASTPRQSRRAVQSWRQRSAGSPKAKWGLRAASLDCSVTTTDLSHLTGTPSRSRQRTPRRGE